MILCKGGEHAAVKKTKLCYRFHDPNPAAVTADYLLTILIEANKEKVAQAIRERSGEVIYTEGTRKQA